MSILKPVLQGVDRGRAKSELRVVDVKARILRVIESRLSRNAPVRRRTREFKLTEYKIMSHGSPICSFAKLCLSICVCRSKYCTVVFECAITHLSNYNYRANVTFFRAEFERHSSTRRRRSGVERRETAGE